MNSATLESTVETPAAVSSEAPLSHLSELHAVELAYVGGGMGNVAFM